MTKSLRLIRCPMNFTLFFVTVVMMFLSSSISCKILSFLFLSVQLVFIVVLKIHISINSNLSFTYFFMVVFHPYNKILQIYDLMKFFLVLMTKFLFVNKNLFFSNAFFAKAILLSASFVDMLFSIIRLPEQQNAFNYSTDLSLILMFTVLCQLDLLTTRTFFFFILILRLNF